MYLPKEVGQASKTGIPIDACLLCSPVLKNQMRSHFPPHLKMYHSGFALSPPEQQYLFSKDVSSPFPLPISHSADWSRCDLVSAQTHPIR